MPSSAAASSSDYRIFETNEFLKVLTRIETARPLRKRLETRVYPQLRHGPFFGPNIRKLQSYDPPVWRYRIGPYRVFYSIDEKEKIVFILTIDDRKDAYR